MKSFAIVADATCDLGEELRREYDIRIVAGHVKMPDGREISLLPGWTEFSKEQFYSELKEYPNSFTTSPANVAEFTEAFTAFAKDGCDVLCMTISGGISGAFGFASEAAKAVMKDFPGVKIICVDSMRFGPGFGLMALRASALRAEGKSLDETHEWLEANKNRYHQAGWLDDLSFVAKKGRLTHAKAFFGTLAGVKPIGEFDYNGLTTVIGKVKGAKTAYAALLDYIEKTIEEPAEQVIYIAQTNRQKEAETYKKLIEERFSPKAVIIKDVYPLCAINIGPGLMAAYYTGKPISRDLGAERKILEDFISGGKK